MLNAETTQPGTCVTYSRTPFSGQLRKCISVSKNICPYTCQTYCYGAENTDIFYENVYFVVESEREETHQLFLENSESVQVKHIYICHDKVFILRIICWKGACKAVGLPASLQVMGVFSVETHWSIRKPLHPSRS